MNPNIMNNNSEMLMGDDALAGDARNKSSSAESQTQPLTLGSRSSGTFVVKLHAILSDEEFKNIICWQEHGTAWSVIDQQQFENKICPLYFKHNRFSSFVRQAYLWGFRRVSTGPDKGCFFHEQFVRDDKDACRRMVRKTTSTKKGQEVQLLLGQIQPGGPAVPSSVSDLPLHNNTVPSSVVPGLYPGLSGSVGLQRNPTGMNTDHHSVASNGNNMMSIQNQILELQNQISVTQRIRMALQQQMDAAASNGYAPASRIVAAGTGIEVPGLNTNLLLQALQSQHTHPLPASTMNNLNTGTLGHNSLPSFALSRSPQLGGQPSRAMSRSSCDEDTGHGI